MALYKEEENKKKFLEKLKQNKTPSMSGDNIIGPGGHEFFNAKKQVKEAYEKGGFSSAAGIALRKTPGVLAATVRDTITPEPLRRGLSSLAGEAGNFGSAALTGDVTPIEKVSADRSKILADNIAQQSLNQLSNPVISEIPNVRRDTELGKITSSAKSLADGGQRNTFSIGGNTLSYDLSKKDLSIKKSIEDIDAKIAQGFEPTPEQSQRIAELKRKAGFTLGGTDRKLSTNEVTGLQQLGNGLEVTFDSSIPQDRRLEFMKNSSGEMSEKETDNRNLAQQQWLARQGYSKSDPYAGLSNRAKRELLVQKSKNKQSGVNNAATNAIAEERNRILEEGNIRQEERLSTPKQVKPDVRVIKVPDGFGGFKDQIMRVGPDGNYISAMGDQQDIKPMPKNKKELLSGESYLLPDGRMGIWDGENFTL